MVLSDLFYGCPEKNCSALAQKGDPDAKKQYFYNDGNLRCKIHKIKAKLYCPTCKDYFPYSVPAYQAHRKECETLVPNPPSSDDEMEEVLDSEQDPMAKIEKRLENLSIEMKNIHELLKRTADKQDSTPGNSDVKDNTKELLQKEIVDSLPELDSAELLALRDRVKKEKK